MTSDGQRKVEKIEGMRGGKGVVAIERLLDEEQLDGKCRMYAKITLEPHASIGYHVHEGESETFFILSGEGSFNDNQKKTLPVKPGDATYTGSRRGHGIENTGAAELVMMALIILGD